MTTPHRVQLSRAKDWRKPDNTVVVARPRRWGNPFRVGDVLTVEHSTTTYEITDREDAVRLFANWLSNTLDAEGRYVHGMRTYFGAESSARPSIDEIRSELAGRNLACWCPLDQPCHADVLLRIANAEAG